MGMFDSFRDEYGNEWQTKAYDRILATYRVGDEVPALGEDLSDYQVEVYGHRGEAVATIGGGVVRAIPAERDQTLPLVAGRGGIKDFGGPQPAPHHEAERSHHEE